MSSVAGQSLAVGNLGKVGHGDAMLSRDMLRSEKLQGFVSRYLELSNELRDRHGEKGAYLQLGKIFTEKVGESDNDRVSLKMGQNISTMR